MNPMLGAALGSIVRFVLAIGAGYLVRGGVWQQADSTTYVEATTLAVVAFGWSMYQKMMARQKIVTAVSLIPNFTEAKLDDHIDVAAKLPSVLTLPTEIPVPKTVVR